MNRVIMVFMAVLAVALAVCGYNGQAATRGCKATPKDCPAPVARVKCSPIVLSFLLDAEDAHDTPVTGLLESGVTTKHVGLAIERILQTRKAATYPLPIFIVQHRLLI